MEVKEAVQRAIDVYVANPKCGFDVLHTALTQAGLSADLAQRVNEFLPLPFGRAIFRDNDVQFQPYYVRVDDQGRERFRGLLLDEPVYREALAAVPAVTAQGKDAFFVIQGRSSEFSAINQALHGGSQLGSLAALPPAMLWEEGMPETTPPLAAKPKSWWPFGAKS